MPGGWATLVGTGARVGGQEGNEAVDEVREVLEEDAHTLHHVLPSTTEAPRDAVGEIRDALGENSR